MLVAGSIALSGCGRSSSSPTNISYRQVGICKGYETPAGPITANEGFAVFKIESVDNTKYGSSFSLTPERLYVNQSTPAQAAGQVSNWNRRFVHPDPRFAQTMGFTSIPQTTIPAGEKLDINSVVIIPIGINNPSGGAEAARKLLCFMETSWKHAETGYVYPPPLSHSKRANCNHATIML